MFEETEVVRRPDGTIAIVFKARDADRDFVPVAQICVVGWPTAVTLLGEQIVAALAGMKL